MKLVVKIFAIWGVISLAGIVLLVFTFLFQIDTGQEKIDQISKKDALFVLNWGGLDNTQNYEIVSSYQSPIHMMGDHHDYYCIQIERFAPQKSEKDDWVFGRDNQEIFNQARTLAISAVKAESCFNEPVSGTEKDLAAYIWSINLHGRRVEGSKIIFYHKPSNRLLYVRFET